MRQIILQLTIFSVLQLAYGQYSGPSSLFTSSETSGSSINYNLHWYNTSSTNTITLGFTQSISDFSIGLYETIISENNGNVVMSPFSAQTALSLLYCGANGKTANIMANALDFNKQNENEITNQYRNLLTPLQNNPTISVANAIYVMDNYKIQSSFLAKAENDFFAKIAKVDFSQNVAAANTINNWVAEETHDKITNLISPDDLNDGTRTVLLNAIYFKGTWIHHFPPKKTVPQTFYTSSKVSSQVPMMHVEANFNYNFFSNLNAQVIELPYNNSEVSMFVILPQSIDGLPALQNKLETFDFTQLDNQLYSQKIQLSLPKFKIETTLNLNDPLKQLGFANIFSDSADFSKMLSDSSGSAQALEVSQVIQKAYIEVNEQGTTAAAATGIMIMADALIISTPIIFNANHPFVFLLKTPASILFIGNYIEP